jgi:DNA-directed RNA polymerase subunit M/transcription elongation factor TFIIS
MKDYLVFLCPKCGTVRYARESQKTAKCLKCGYTIQIRNHRMRILFRSNEVKKAKEKVQKLKEKAKFRGRLYT